MLDAFLRAFVVVVLIIIIIVLFMNKFNLSHLFKFFLLCTHYLNLFVSARASFRNDDDLSVI